MTSYVKIESWHILDESEEVPETLCGLHPTDDSVFDTKLSLTEKSCETCLRLNAAGDFTDEA